MTVYEPDISTSGVIGVASDGIGIAQTSNQVRMFFHLIEEYNLMGFIELGVLYGGIANLMLKYKNEKDPDFLYCGFEINQSQIVEKIRNIDEIKIMDVQSQGCVNVVKELIDNSSGAVLVLCDNGNKQNEMELYAPALRVGDFLMAHDYPGEVTDTFLDQFGISHPEFEEIWFGHLRAENGAALWRKNA